MIKIKVKDQSYDMVTKEVQMVLDVVVDLKKSLEVDHSRGMAIDAENAIKNEIVDVVTTKYVEDFADEIIKKVDMEALVKRVQLDVLRKI